MLTILICLAIGIILGAALMAVLAAGSCNTCEYYPGNDDEDHGF